MNPAAILALIGDLYQQVAELTAENKALRDDTTKPPEPAPDPRP